jgi:hypothetical protein
MGPIPPRTPRSWGLAVFILVDINGQLDVFLTEKTHLITLKYDALG